MPYQIELRNIRPSRCDAAETMIKALSALEPDDLMNKNYKLKIKLTEIASINNRWYMSCKECWKKLRTKGNIYKYPTCVAPMPAPRYKLRVQAVDLDSTEKENPTFAEFMFFGPQGDIAIRTDANYVSSRTEGGNWPGATRDIRCCGQKNNCYRAQPASH